MMKRYLALLLLVIMAVSVVSAATTATAAPKRLERPQLLAPRNHAVLLLYQLTNYKWKAVHGTTSYRMELQKGTPDPSHPRIIRWTSDPGSPLVITGTSVGFGLGQTGAYRWRITALGSTPSLNSAPSAWRYLTVR